MKRLFSLLSFTVFGLALPAQTAFPTVEAEHDKHTRLNNPLQICATTCCSNSPISEVTVQLQTLYNPLEPALQITSSGATNCGTMDIDHTLGAQYTASVSKTDDPLNGVSTYDLILIAKHILGIAPITDPCKLIAADVNRSGTITAFDIVELRKLILGIYTELPNNQSWFFFDANFQPSPVFPYITFSSTVTFNNPADFPDGIPFIGIKTGDVNCNALLNNLVETADDRAAKILKTENRLLHKGQSALLPFYFENSDFLQGFQMEITLNNRLIQLEEVIPGALTDMHVGNFALPRPETLSVSWNTADGRGLNVNCPVFYLKVTALETADVADCLAFAADRLRPEVYGENGGMEPLELAFDQLKSAETPRSTVQVWPNPTTAGAWLAIPLGEPSALELTVMDAWGKMVFFKKTTAEEGAHQLEIPADALQTTGTYFWSLKANNTVNFGILSKT